MQEKERRLRDLIKTVACVDEFADWLSPDELLRWSRELLRANEELDRLREELDKTPPE
jgi:hypothetical protein